MKKKISLILMIIFVCVMCNKALLNKRALADSDKRDKVESINDKIIRFHVLANSDSKEDQELKLKVKDKVLEYIYPKLEESKSLDESRKILKENDSKIKEIAIEEIKNNNYNYAVNTELSMENFPIKTYGNITLPQGKYEAYRIMIGNAEGQNWWCVMFPPLCFVDITKGEVANKDTEKCMKKVLSDEEYSRIDTSKKIKFKSKIIESIKNITSKNHKSKNKSSNVN